MLHTFTDSSDLSIAVPLFARPLIARLRPKRSPCCVITTHQTRRRGAGGHSSGKPSMPRKRSWARSGLRRRGSCGRVGGVAAGDERGFASPATAVFTWRGLRAVRGTLARRRGISARSENASRTGPRVHQSDGIVRCPCLRDGIELPFGPGPHISLAVNVPVPVNVPEGSHAMAGSTRGQSTFCGDFGHGLRARARLRAEYEDRPRLDVVIVAHASNPWNFEGDTIESAIRAGQAGVNAARFIPHRSRRCYLKPTRAGAPPPP
jgi:hypothetical protein